MKIYKTINGHLVQKGSTYGNTKPTAWISFTKDLNQCIDKYCNNWQPVHAIAVIKPNIVGACDWSGNIARVAADLSEESIIKNNNYLKNANGEKTSLDFKGFKYSMADLEVVYYNHIPPERIVSVLWALQIDLIYNKAFDYEAFFNLDVTTQQENLKSLLNDCEKIIKDSCCCDMQLFDYIYKKNYSFNKIIANGYDYGKIFETKRKML